MSGTIPLPTTITAQDWQLIVSILMRQPYAEVHDLLARLALPTVVLSLPAPPFDPPPKRFPE